MYFTDDSLFPENMKSLIITAAPYGLKLCVAQGVQACNLGVPILAEELDQHDG